MADFARVERHLEPQAEIGLPVSFFKERGLVFEEDVDDLDAYEFVDVSGSTATPPFALMRYRSDPTDRTTLLFAPEATEVLTFGEIITSIATALGVSSERFHWRSE